MQWNNVPLGTFLTGPLGKVRASSGVLIWGPKKTSLFFLVLKDSFLVSERTFFSTCWLGQVSNTSSNNNY